ncbi:amidohydrolase family protein [Thermococcus thioreducens]|uniref:5-methylthioadenosine/S-adenosylhomocysteine deaminase n=1 Tax=Thermococcus thioreducens TaxID=277988 RepID=A0A0Q2M2Y8_9EURY|nr:amidohydrolase [Thermococcus thioreducens]ASJ12806.1 amidohydrolase [Thermococcus thioreducens]KQH82274.1 amidohydrolase [Thermococcus thioreducens]SEV84961.1 5-methylthioadenosine/S-adenosylhomocysteine deaminase [Thermococcus thioreducens]
MKALVGTLVDGEGVKENSAVLIEGSVIRDVVPVGRLGEYGIDEVYGGRGYIILPGLVNAHTHVAMAKFRGLGEDVPIEQWLNDVIWPAELEWTPEEIRRWALLGMAEALANGSTAINDHYFFADEIGEAARELGIRAFIGQTMMDLVEFPIAEPEEGFKFFKRWSGNDELVKPILAPHATNTVSLELMEEIGGFAHEKNALIHVHLSQSMAEVETVKRRYGLMPVEYLEMAGVLDDHLIGVHGIYLSEKEVPLYAKSGATLVHCSLSMAKLEGRIAPIIELAKNRTNIALGNDSPNPVGLMDPFEEMRFAAVLNKVWRRRTDVASAREVFRWATAGGARALKLKAGLIKPGYLADLVLINARKPQFLPGENLYSHIVYSTRGSDVELVMVNGEVVYRNGLFIMIGKTLEELWKEVRPSGR